MRRNRLREGHAQVLPRLFTSNTAGADTFFVIQGSLKCRLRLALWEVADCLDGQFCHQEHL